MKSAPSNSPIACCVTESVRRYFDDLNGEQVSGLYELVLSEVEKPLLQAVLEHTDQNQTRAARMLGINRNTLRKKLKAYGLG